MNKIYLCQQEELTEYQTRGFQVAIDDESLLDMFLLKQDGHIRAYLNHCPHLGISLNWQPDEFMSLEGTHIQCSTHGALFTLENGECVAGPCRGQALTALNVEVDTNGGIYLISSN